MVQVFDPTPAQGPAGQLGQALGTLGGIGARYGVREYGLSQAQQAAEEAEGDPVKLAFSLARASAYAPEMQRSLGQIYEQLLARSQGGQVAEGLPGDEGGTLPSRAPPRLNNAGTTANPDDDGEISPKGIIPNSTDVPSNTQENRTLAARQPVEFPKGKLTGDDLTAISNQYINDLRPDLIQGSVDFGKIPTFNYALKSDLRPEEEKQLRQNLINQNYSPKAIESIVDKVRKDVQTRFQEYQNFHNLKQQRQQSIDKRWEDFTKLGNEKLPNLIGRYQDSPKTYDDLTNKYFQHARNEPVDSTPQQIHASARAKLDRNLNQLAALDAVPPMPWVRNPQDVTKYIDTYKDQFKRLVDEGMYETAKEYAAKKDLGIEEMHASIWGDQTDVKSIQQMDIPAPKEYVEGPIAGALAIPTKKYNPKYPKERRKYIDRLANRLKNIGPDDDLILLRAQVLNKGGKVNDFAEALNLAKQRGLNLSPFQESIENEVRVPRKQPIWQIFSGAVPNWINYLRGKR